MTSIYWSSPTPFQKIPTTWCGHAYGAQLEWCLAAWLWIKSLVFFQVIKICWNFSMRLVRYTGRHQSTVQYSDGVWPDVQGENTTSLSAATGERALWDTKKVWQDDNGKWKNLCMGEIVMLMLMRDYIIYLNSISNIRCQTIYDGFLFLFVLLHIRTLTL